MHQRCAHSAIFYIILFYIHTAHSDVFMLNAAFLCLFKSHPYCNVCSFQGTLIASYNKQTNPFLCLHQPGMLIFSIKPTLSIFPATFTTTHCLFTTTSRSSFATVYLPPVILNSKNKHVSLKATPCYR